VGHVDQAERLADILGCGFATLPVKYLGLPLGASYKSTHIWDGSLRRLNIVWLVGKGCISLKVVE
jgi:hypothetical protein